MTGDAVSGLVGLAVLGWLYWLVIWISFAAAAAVVASAKGRSAIGHFLITLLVPPVGIFLVWALPPRIIEGVQGIEDRLRILSNTAADFQRRLPPSPPPVPENGKAGFSALS